MKCKNQIIYKNLRNPINEVLKMVGSSLIGMYNSEIIQTSVSELNKIPSCYESPIYSLFDIESSQRAYLLRSLEFCLWMKGRNTEDYFYLEKNQIIKLQNVDNLILKAIQYVNNKEFSLAASIINYIYRQIKNQQIQIKRIKDKQQLLKMNTIASKNNEKKKENLISKTTERYIKIWIGYFVSSVIISIILLLVMIILYYFISLRRMKK